jgi:divalent metal cation (Fe/Co/Zn/Cd) transporter
MAEPAISASDHRIRWGWWLVGLAVSVIVAALIGYQVVQPFSDRVNDLLGSLNIGE